MSYSIPSRLHNRLLARNRVTFTAIRTSLTDIEKKSLVLVAFSITLELASRFLDDYLKGDSYFKVNYPGHNLIRTRCQLALAKDIQRKCDELEWIVEDTLSQGD